MPQDTYGFRSIPMGGMVKLDADIDLVYKSAYYWGKVLNCRFSTEMVGSYVEVRRHPRLYRNRDKVDMSRWATGDHYDLMCSNPNTDREFLRYHASKNDIEIETELAEDPKGRPMLKIKVKYAPARFKDRTVPRRTRQTAGA